ncbi:MAG TPA: OB-fold nucleic acid binding domain-containing protein, partial [Acidimicrobiales bacterium]|nr:OB-fold nucleic acid binding domain-containing protein [Acidimicrobiales bacterium]
RREEQAGIATLFAALEDGPTETTEAYVDTKVPIPDTEFDKAQRLAFEKEMLGLYVSDHPLAGLEGALAAQTDMALGALASAPPMARVVVGGVLGSVVFRRTRRGELMATAVLADRSGQLPLTVFPRDLPACRPLLADDTVVVATGRVERRDDDVVLLVEQLRPLGEPQLRIGLAPDALDPGDMRRLRELLGRHPGAVPVYVTVGPGPTLRLPPAFSVDPSGDLCAELRAELPVTELAAPNCHTLMAR